MLTLSLVVFRERFGEGVGSFSNLIGAGGIGVLLGILTVGALEDRFTKERIVAGAFFVGGLVILAVSFAITGTTVLLASFAVGLTFAWKKIPIDTMVQEALPDGYRGRVFAAYDVAYNLARIVAAALAIPMLPHLGVSGSVAVVGIVFLLWTPVLPRVDRADAGDRHPLLRGREGRGMAARAGVGRRRGAGRGRALMERGTRRRQDAAVPVVAPGRLGPRREPCRTGRHLADRPRSRGRDGLTVRR